MTFGQYLESQKIATSKMTLGEYYKSQALECVYFEDDNNDFGHLPPYNRGFETNCNSFQNSYNNEFKFKSDDTFKVSIFMYPILVQ